MFARNPGLAPCRRATQEVELLPPLYGRVPEELLANAIEAIARAALPADAFDSCARDAAACPKPPPPPPLPPLPPPLPPAVPPPAPPVAAIKSGVCVRASAPPRHLTVHADPDSTAAVVTRLAPGQCGIHRTGFKDAYAGASGWSTWEEVNVDGYTGWIREGVLAPRSGRSPASTAGAPSPFGEAQYRRRYRGSR